MGHLRDMLMGGFGGTSQPVGFQSTGFYPQPAAGQPDPMGFYPQPQPLPVQPTYDFGAFARPQPQPVYRTQQPQMQRGGFMPDRGGQRGGQSFMGGNNNTATTRSTLDRALYGGSLLDSRAAQAAAFGAGLAVPGLGMAAKGIDIAQRVANANAVNAMLGKEPMSFREIVSRGLSPNIAIDSDVSHFQRAATLGNNINVEAALKDYNKGVPMNPGNRPSPGINRGGMNLGNRPGPGMNRGYGGSGGGASGASRGNFGGRSGRPGSGEGGRGRDR